MKTQRLIPLGTPQPIQMEAGLPPPKGRGAPRALQLNRRKLQVEGVREEWRIDDEWWRRPISRLYFTVILENGRLVTLYHDLVEGGWFLQP
ncbi:MAG: hypothetical protein WEA09_06755 [Gemmatimonadota bacterium]